MSEIAKKWYVVRAISGKEKKCKALLGDRDVKNEKFR